MCLHTLIRTKTSNTVRKIQANSYNTKRPLDAVFFHFLNNRNYECLF